MPYLNIVRNFLSLRNKSFW